MLYSCYMSEVYATMLDMGKPVDSTRLTISLPKRLRQAVSKLADIGIHGSSDSEVAKSLISRAVEDLISDGFFEKHRAID